MSVVTDFLIFGSIISFIYYGFYFEAYKNGFWCNDASIRHPLKPMVVDFRILLAVVFILPILIMLIVKRKGSSYHIKNFLYCQLTNILLTTYCKVIIGRPRPNFIYTCAPNVNCTLDENKFIDTYSCTTTDRHLYKNSNESFFSGHSSLGTSTAFFLIFYLNDKLKINGFLKAHLFFIIFMLGLFPGLTQYKNFWHHASDVIIGDLVGILLASFSYHGSKYFNSNTEKNTKLHKSKE